MIEVTPNTEFVIGIYFGQSETAAAFSSLKDPYDKFNLDILPGIKVIKSAVAILEQEEQQAICIGDSAIENATHAKDFQISFKKRPSEMTITDRTRMVAFMKGVYSGILERYPDYKTREHVVYIAQPFHDKLWKSEESAYLKIAEDAGIPVAGFQNKFISALFEHCTLADSYISSEVKNGVLFANYGEDSIALSYFNYSLPYSIDDELPLGASQVEKTLLEYALVNPSDAVMPQFAALYGRDEDSIPYNILLDVFKRAKEVFYGKKLPVFRVAFDYGYLTSSEKQKLFGFGCISIPKQQLDKILGKNVKGGYIQNVKDAVIAFKDEKLKDNKVSYVFLTGGASRMDLIREIFMNVFGLDNLHCVTIDIPSTVISQGVASLARNLIKVKDNNYDLEKSFIGHLITIINNKQSSVGNNSLNCTMKIVTPNTEFVIGIDFGHGETSAAFYSLRSAEDKLDLDILPGQKVIKSAVAIMGQEGVPAISVGDAAIANAPMAKVFQVSFKKRPSEMSSSERNLMVAFMKGVYAGIIEQHPDYKTREHVVYVARPSQDELWKSEEEAYLKIAEDAGMPVAGIQKESRAAYFRARTQPESKIDQQVKKGVLIVDFGSSTIDFTYLNQSLTSPIDGGCPLGASQVEKLLMEYAFAHPIIPDDAMHQFYQTYGMDENSIPYNRLLFEFRKKKEDYYKNKLSSFSLLFDLHDLTSSEKEQIPLGKFGGVNINKVQIDEILGKNTLGGYIENVKNAVIAFKNENLRDYQVACVYLTGGASRMDFVREIFMEVFALDAEHCPIDDYPELIVSQGVAHLSYADIKTKETEETLKNKVKQLIDNFNWDYEIRKIVGSEIVHKVQKEAADIMSKWVSGSIYQTIYIDDLIDKARYRTTESGSTHIHNLNSLSKEFEQVFNSFLYRDFAKGCEERINSEILSKVITQLTSSHSAYRYKPLSQRLVINEISARISQSGVSRLRRRFIGEGSGHIIYDAVAKLCKGVMVDWNIEKDRAVPFRMNHRNYFDQYYSSIFTAYEWDDFINKDIELSGISQAKAITSEYAEQLVEEYISYAKLAKFFN